MKVELDLLRWERYTSQLERRRETAPPELLAKAQSVVRRAAAVDTGAIEGLYEVDRGFTFTVATEAAFWQAALGEKGEEVRGYIEDQLEAYEYILNLATQETPLSEASVRSLHEIMCRSQETYSAITEIGPQKVQLKKGEYKTSPNHVRGRDGEIHAYAPVDVTPSEMYRLIQELRSEAFLNAHPVLQASYAHYAFVLIHPFADGNGRVARALASIFTYRAQSIPLLILFEKRGEYIDALGEADRGNFRVFIDFVLERTLDSIQLVEESIRAAEPRSARESLSSLRNLNQTKSGYTHEEIDRAALELMKQLRLEVAEFAKTETRESSELLDVRTTTVLSHTVSSISRPILSGYRFVNHQNQPQERETPSTFSLRITTKNLPKTFSIECIFVVIVPNNSGVEDDITIQMARRQNASGYKQAEIVFQVRLSELLSERLPPQVSAVTQMRLRMLSQSIVEKALAELEEKAREAIRGSKN